MYRFSKLLLYCVKSFCVIASAAKQSHSCGVQPFTLVARGLPRRSAPRNDNRPKSFCLSVLLPFLLLTLSTSLALGVEFQAIVDKRQGTIEDYFLLTLRLKDASNAPDFELPSLPNFRVIPQGQSTQQQWINGKRSSHVSYNYLLAPQKVGELTIPSLSLEIEGQTYKTRTLRVIVTPADQTPKAERKLFAEASLSSEKAYINQQILYTFEFFVQEGVDVTGLQLERPDFSDFRVEELGKEQRYQRVLNGRAFEVIAVHLALYPLKEGTLRLTATGLSGSRLISRRSRRTDPFGFSSLNRQRKPFRVQTEPLSLEVLPFPEEGRPDDFYGLVGDYVIRAELSAEQLKAGESSTLTIQITGTGLAEWIQMPKLTWDSSFKLYEDQPTYETGVQEQTQIGRASFSLAIVPSKAGHFDLEMPQVSFFDPESQSYQTRRVTLAQLIVEQGAEELLIATGNDASVQKQKVQQLGQDLLPIHKDWESLESIQGNDLSALFYSGLLAFPPLFFGVGWILQRQSKHRLVHQDRFRASRAFAQFQKQLKACEAESDDAQRVAQMVSSIQLYIGNKANREGEAFTAQEIREWLGAQGVEEALIEPLDQLLEQCHLVQYAGQSFSATQQQEWLQKAHDAIQRLEKVL